MASPTYPIRFRECLRNYGFGGRWIVREFAKTGLPADHRIAETWEVCDRPDGETSVIINGPLAGKTLRQAIDEFGADLLGTEMTRRFGKVFPLLIKFLDATYELGEQAHQDDELTKQRGIKDFFGKTEAWYMLRALPGATVDCGNRPGVTPQGLYDAIMAGKSKECMTSFPARPGDAFMLYAGTMHHADGGVLFYEVMQNSNVGVSLRPPDPTLPQDQRELRARQAVDACHLEDGYDAKCVPVTLTAGKNRRTYAMVCQHFALERLDLAEPLKLPADSRKFRVLSVVEGQATVSTAGGSEQLSPGNTVLIPATAGEVRIEPTPTASILLTYVPDLQADIVEPLRQAGIADSAIAALGGKTKQNPLAAIVGRP